VVSPLPANIFIAYEILPQDHFTVLNIKEGELAATRQIVTTP